jgi:erythromycin esterase-like protein
MSELQEAMNLVRDHLGQRMHDVISKAISANSGDTDAEKVCISRECAERAITNAEVERENSEAAADESLAYRDKASVEHLGHGETKKIGLWLHNLHLILFWFCFSIVILTLI